MNRKVFGIFAFIAVLLVGIAAIGMALGWRLTSDTPAKAMPVAVSKKPRPRPKATPKPRPRPKADADTTAEPSPIVRGTLTDDEGKPVEGIVVSDGYSCVKTNAEGLYIFVRHPEAHFVYYSVPDYCAIPVHSDSDRTAAFYKPLLRDSSVYDFHLQRLAGGKEKHFRLIVFGDPQVTNALNPYYTGPDDNEVKKTDVARFTDETMADVKSTLASWPATMPVYALSMGDDVQYYGGFNPSLERQIRRALGSSRAIVCSVIGNHDQDGRDLYLRKWEESFGPTDYSFDRGDVHFVCLNDVHFYRGSRYYSPGELTDEQLQWLYEDLHFADHNKKLIICYHIPLTFGNAPSPKAQPLGLKAEPGHYSSSSLRQLLVLTAGFKGGFELFCGHTHFAINHEINFEGFHITEHCHAAACGNIWQSNVNICGTPNGYYVYDISGTAFADSYYKGTFWPRQRQMTVFRAGTAFNGESYAADWLMPKAGGEIQGGTKLSARDSSAIFVNVFNADSRWRVVAIENGVAHDMQRVAHQGQDAFAAGYHHRYAKATSFQFVNKSNGYLIMNHLYYYQPNSPTSHVTIRAIDPYGHTYEASTAEAQTEPFFNFAHYYKHPQHYEQHR